VLSGSGRILKIAIRYIPSIITIYYEDRAQGTLKTKKIVRREIAQTNAIDEAQ